MKKTSLGSLCLLILSVVLMFGYIDNIYADITTKNSLGQTITYDDNGVVKDSTPAGYNVGDKVDTSGTYGNNKDLYDQSTVKTTDGTTTGGNGSDSTSGNSPSSGDPSSSDFVGPPAPGATATSEDMSTDNILGVPTSDLRKGNVDQSTLPLVIVNVIETLLAVAGTVAIFSLIYHAVQMQINSGITGDSSGVDKAKKGMIGSVIGFIIAILAWFIVTRAVELLGAVT